MDDNIGAFCIEDGEVKRASECSFPDINTKKVVYEVIRIIDGIPLFAEDHFERMEGSLTATSGMSGLKLTELKQAIKSLLKANGSENCNVKLTVFEESGVQRHLAYISKSYYPGNEEILKGVPVGLIRLERQNPNAKVLSMSYREAVSERIRQGGFFEVLLVNRNGRITEGSKSNVFFFREGRIYTAPGTEVLKGITRKYVFEACMMAGYEIVEEAAGIDDLDKTEALFLSGTSIKVLPVCGIDGFKYASAAHPAIISIREAYDSIVRKYIDDNVKIW